MEISICDTGHGIQDDRRHLIFLPFFTTKEKGRGTGLGLYISKRIVEQHEGTIESHSVFGKGTTFTIRIPAVIGSSRTEDQDAQNTRSAHEGEEHEKQPG